MDNSDDLPDPANWQTDNSDDLPDPSSSLPEYDWSRAGNFGMSPVDGSDEQSYHGPDSGHP